MNNMKHTPEPWSLHESYHAKPNSVPITTNVPTSEDGPEFTSWECVIASGDCIVSQVTGWDSPSGGFPRANNPEEVVANAQRIIACVNACAGINPEAVPDLMALAQKVARLNKGAGEIGAGMLNQLVDLATAATSKAAAP